MAIIKGYFVSNGYMGWVEWLGDYILFASQSDYYDYLIDIEESH